MSTESKKEMAEADGQGFIRKTITLPEDVADFAEKQASKPAFVGNMSGYIRNLILQDRERLTKKKAA